MQNRTIGWAQKVKLDLQVKLMRVITYLLLRKSEEEVFESKTIDCFFLISLATIQCLKYYTNSLLFV